MLSIYCSYLGRWERAVLVDALAACPALTVSSEAVMSALHRDVLHFALGGSALIHRLHISVVIFIGAGYIEKSLSDLA